jgi:aldehyde:ferredoxin oxidoreductase
MMTGGYTGKILHVDLTSGETEVEEPNETFYRTYLGGSAMGAYYLFRDTPKEADPLGPENTLSLMLGPVTGAPISGQSRVSATAKSPLSGLAAESTGGGFWPAELKFAGFDGIVIRGKAEKPVYLWVHDGEVALRDADHLCGKFTAEVEDLIREELDDEKIHVLQCGPAAEKGVLFGALINYANRANGRSGMGTVMAAKNLKAVAVRGTQRPDIADRDALMELAKWGAQNVSDSGVTGLHEFGTAGITLGQSASGGLPTRNWSSGYFEGAEDITGETMAETIRVAQDTCYACAVRCKQVVEVTDGPYEVDPRYGGPEYESLATLGSYCGVSDLAAIARANQLCNMYGMDTISCGAAIAWAMDCFEHGLLTEDDTGGIDLRFGNAEAMVRMVEMIGEREGLGEVLGKGSARAARELGVGENLVVAVKNHELPAHMPQVKRSMAVIYGVHPGGADHTVFEHDPGYLENPDRVGQLGLHDPQPADVLNAEKVRYALYTYQMVSAVDSLSLCWFVHGGSWQLYGPNQVVDVVNATTGWDLSLFELMKVGERRINLLRAFNAREGADAEDDALPPKLMQPLEGGSTDGVAVGADEAAEGMRLFYRMAGWDANGRPTDAKLAELELGWAAEEL